MLRAVSGQTDHILSRWLDGEYEDAEKVREALLEARSRGSDPYNMDARPEQRLHDSLYDVLQRAVHRAESAILDARELAYLVAGSEVLSQAAAGADGREPCAHSDALRYCAERWLDRNGRNSLKEGVRR